MENTVTKLNMVCEFEVKYKSNVKKSELPKISSSIDAKNILQNLFEEYIDTQEAFGVLFLNKANKVVGGKIMFLGCIDSCVCDPRIIFRNALLLNASAIIISHNHPSGNLNPSDMDKKLTKKILEAGKLLDITVLDHIILTDDNHYSFADTGNLY